MIINTEQLKQLLAEYAKVTETEASTFVDALVNTILTHLEAGEEVPVSGLGVFYIVDSQQGKRVAFRPEEKLKEAVNAPFSFFEPLVVGEPISQKEVEEIVVTSEDDEEPVPEEPAIPEEPATPESAPAVEPQPEPETKEKAPNCLLNASELDDTEAELQEISEHYPSSGYTLKKSGSIYEREEDSQTHIGLLLLAIVSAVALVVGGIYVLLTNRELVAGKKQTVVAMEVEPKPVVVAEVIDSLPVEPDSVPLLAELSVDSVADVLPEVATVQQEVVQQEVVQQEVVQQEVVKPEVTQPVAELPVEVPVVEGKPTPEMLMLEADGTPKMMALEPGERLALLSARLYGDKSFWGYIFEVNAFQLKSPNSVPSGKNLYLPNAQYFKIDANDEASVKRGKQKQKEILNAYGLE